MNRILIKVLLAISIVFLLGAFSCGSGVSQADYDNLKSKLSQTESQLKALQDKLASQTGTATPTITTTQPVTQSTDLSKTIEDLKKQIAALDTQKTAAEASLKELNTKYTELQKQYDALTKPAEITAEQVEQAIFKLINQERTSSNVTGLLWGNNLYTITRQNSQHMSETGKYEYSTWGFYQQIFMAASYGSVDGIARGAVQVWKINQYQFEHGILSKAFKYGAVGAYKQGDVVFITFMAADVP